MVQKGSKIASRVSSSGSSASVVTWASRMRRDSLAIACCPSSYRIDMRRGLSADREFLGLVGHQRGPVDLRNADRVADLAIFEPLLQRDAARQVERLPDGLQRTRGGRRWLGGDGGRQFLRARRSEEHTSELQSLMRISYAVFCLKKKN